MLLALLGALGLTVGALATLTFASFFNYSSALIGALAGVVVGASLGAAFGDWRTIVILAGVGGVGFGVAKIQKLKDLGIHFAIDDFGTGYSCLHYLKRLPVDYLKIDRSFIEGIGQNPEDEAIVSGTIALGHALDLRVVAEGVETAEQLARLQEMGCDLAQGNHFSEPLPHQAVKKLLVEGLSAG